MGDIHQSLDQMSLTLRQRAVAMQWLQPKGTGAPEHLGSVTQDGRTFENYRRLTPEGVVQEYEVWRDGDGDLQIRTYKVAPEGWTGNAGVTGPRGGFSNEMGRKNEWAPAEPGGRGPEPSAKLVGGEASVKYGETTVNSVQVNADGSSWDWEDRTRIGGVEAEGSLGSSGIGFKVGGAGPSIGSAAKYSMAPSFDADGSLSQFSIGAGADATSGLDVHGNLGMKDGKFKGSFGTSVGVGADVSVSAGSTPIDLSSLSERDRLALQIEGTQHKLEHLHGLSETAEVQNNPGLRDDVARRIKESQGALQEFQEKEAGLSSTGAAGPQLESADDESASDLLGRRRQEITFSDDEGSMIDAKGQPESDHNEDAPKYNAAELLAAGYSVADCREGGVSSEAMHEADVAPDAMIEGGYSVQELHSGGYVASELKEADIPASDIHGVYSAEEVHGAYTAEDIHGVYTAEEVHGIFTAEEIHGNYTPEEIHGIYTPDEIHGVFSAQEIHGTYTPEEIHGIYTPDEIHGVFSAQEIHGTYTPEEIHGIYTPDEIHGVFTAEEIHGTYTSEEIHGVYTPDEIHGVFTAEEIHGTYSSEEIHGVYTPDEIHGVFTAEEIHGTYSSEEIHGVYTPEEIHGVFTADEIHGTYTPGEIHGIYSAAEIHGVFGADEIHGVYPADELLGVYDAGALRQGGFEANELHEGGFAANDLRSGGYEASELSVGGYRVDEVHVAGYALVEMRDCYPLEELATTFELEELRIEFSVEELMTAGLVEGPGSGDSYSGMEY